MQELQHVACNNCTRNHRLQRELAISSLAVAETTDSTHCAYPWRDGQVELSWVVCYMPVVCPSEDDHPSKY